MCSYSKEYEESRRLLVRAIASAKAKEFKPAKRMLEKVLRIPATFEQTAEAHYWLSEISDDEERRREHLEMSLGNNPAHHLARKNLAILNGKLNPSDIIDPNHIHPSKESDTLLSVGKRFVCSQCGGKLTFSPDGLDLICEYCESRQQVSGDGTINETDFLVGISTLAGHKKAEIVQSFACKACGAVYLLSPEILSLTCPHCDSTYSINSTETSELIPPEGIIPFSIRRNEVGQIITDWLKLKKISKSPHIGTLSGIYLPFWTFDITGLVTWRGEISENESYYPTVGQKLFSFDDILIPACVQIPFDLGEIIKNLNPSDIVPYSPAYISNWLAETYTVIMSDAAIEGRSEAFNTAKKVLRERDDVREVININFSSAGLFIEGFKLILAPVWIGEYVFSGHKYAVTINGHNGDIRGQLPPTRLERFSNWLIKKK